MKFSIKGKIEENIIQFIFLPNDLLFHNEWNGQSNEETILMGKAVVFVYV
jgi:hypothetical protein